MFRGHEKAPPRCSSCRSGAIHSPQHLSRKASPHAWYSTIATPQTGRLGCPIRAKVESNPEGLRAPRRANSTTSHTQSYQQTRLFTAPISFRPSGRTPCGETPHHRQDHPATRLPHDPGCQFWTNLKTDSCPSTRTTPITDLSGSSLATQN